jgi:hypothetical protein
MSELLIDYFHDKELSSMITNTPRIVTLFCLVLMLLGCPGKMYLPETEGGFFLRMGFSLQREFHMLSRQLGIFDGGLQWTWFLMRNYIYNQILDQVVLQIKRSRLVVC